MSCSATAGMTVQLLYMLGTCTTSGGLQASSYLRDLVASPSLHNLKHFFTLSHTLPLYDSHLNTGLLIAKIQANLVRNKANKMVDKIQPYTLTTSEKDALVALLTKFKEVFAWSYEDMPGIYTDIV